MSRDGVPDSDDIIKDYEAFKLQKSQPRMRSPKKSKLEDINFNDLTGLDFLPKNDTKKHESPTRRLVAMKDSSVKHKTDLKKTRGLGAQPGEYSITYNCSPDKMYVMKPDDEIDYDLYHKNKRKFYDHVFDQDIEKVKVKETGPLAKDGSPKRSRSLKGTKISSKVCNRLVRNLILLFQNLTGKITTAIQKKIKEKIIEKGGLKMLDGIIRKQMENEGKDEASSPTAFAKIMRNL